ncbi:hypothetical protein ACGO3R_11665 [Lactococcus lactis]
MFFWSDYKAKEKEQIHKDFVKGVTNLIEEYGTTFSNKNHGRNLFTKLLLENRLTIEEIPVNELFLNVYHSTFLFKNDIIILLLYASKVKGGV